MVVDELKEFCEEIGGTPNDMNAGSITIFDCKVDPQNLLKHWDELEKVLKSVEGEPVVALFGDHKTDVVYNGEESIVTLNAYKFDVPVEEADEIGDALRDVFTRYILKDLPSGEYTIYAAKVESLAAEKWGKILRHPINPEHELIQVSVETPLEDLGKMKDTMRDIIEFSKAIACPSGHMFRYTFVPPKEKKMVLLR